MTQVAENIVEMGVQVPQVIIQVPDRRGIFNPSQVFAHVFHIIMDVPNIHLQVRQVIDKFAHGFFSLEFL
jgi:hypothetical protein